MRKYYITDLGLKQTEIIPPAHPSLDDKILAALADFSEGMTRRELMLYWNYTLNADNISKFQRTLNNLMNTEYVVFEDE